MDSCSRSGAPRSQTLVGEEVGQRAVADDGGASKYAFVEVLTRARKYRFQKSLNSCKGVLC